MDGITVIRNPSPNNGLPIKTNIDNELNKDTFLKFDQMLENCLKVSVGNYIILKKQQTKSYR